MAYVIKSGHDRPSSSATPFRNEPQRFELEDWSRRAEEVLQKVRDDAQKILDEAAKEAEQIREAAKREGYRAGQRAAEQAAVRVAQQQLSTLMPALDQFRQQLGQARSSFQRMWEVQLLRLAVGIAERLVRQKIESDPKVAREWLSEAIELATHGDRIIVHLNPADTESLAPHLEAIERRLDRSCRLEVVPDDAVDRGACLVNTPCGTVDYRLSAQLQRVMEELTW